MNARGRRIHWLGAGLSSRPGFDSLARRDPGRVVLWNRSRAKADAWVAEHPGTSAKTYSLDELAREISAGEIAVSMLPATEHVSVAKVCLDRGARLVTTSYLSPEMRALHDAAKSRGLAFVNEAGLDPGLDHLFAHSLRSRLAERIRDEELSEVEFTSFCGGFPAVPGEFRYRFSWSPLGVLRALRQPARWIANGSECAAPRPFERVENRAFGAEVFEAYPNRDSAPYVEEYGLGNCAGVLKTFVRGTYRPPGWRAAWESTLSAIQSAGDRELEAIAARLAEDHAYRSHEKDRVCMEVRLRARGRTGARFDERWTIDETGIAGEASAMARLVSLPAAYVVSAIERGAFDPGVCAATREPKRIEEWIDGLRAEGLGLRHEAVEDAGVRHPL